MLGIASRTLVAVEMIALLLLGLYGGLLLFMSGISSLPDFTDLSGLAHASAYISLMPLSYLALGYIRGPASEFVLRIDAAWVLAATTVTIVLVIALLGALGANEPEGLRVFDLAVCIVAVPFFHLLVAALVAPPNTSLERTRER